MMWCGVFPVAFSLLIFAFGLSLALDFKELASRHARRTHAMFGSRHPTPWEFTERRLMLLDRFIGAVFAVVGLLAVVASILGNITVD